MLEDLKLSLRGLMGQEITPEIAARLYASAVFLPELAIDPTQFAPEEFSGHLIAVESFRAIVSELQPLHALHWLETERHQAGAQPNPDYEAIGASEKAGHYLQFTVRQGQGGPLVGSLGMYLGPNRHTGLISAQEDALFIHPDNRIPWLAMRLVRFAFRALITLGVNDLTAHSKLANRADVLMRRLMGDPVALQFFKILR